MITTIKNEDFGWETSAYNYWVAFGNPTFLRWDSTTGSLQRTGSIYIYKYNINTDQHDLKRVIYRPYSIDEDILLAAESSSGLYYDGEVLHTEDTGTVPITADLDISLNLGQYYTASEDGYGDALDINRDAMAVGNMYWRSNVNIDTASIQVAGSGSVDIYDLSVLDINPFIPQETPSISGQIISGGFVYAYVSVPANQSYGLISLEYRATLSDPYQQIASAATSNAGGFISIKTNFTAAVAYPASLQVTGIVSNDPYVVTIKNPNLVVTESFGYTVSLNDEWLAVTSIYESGSKGAVFVYRKDGGPTGDIASWSLFQTISPPADFGPGDGFGSSVSLNKFTSSYSGSMVIGSLKPSQSRAYYYEYDSGSSGEAWTLKYTLAPTYATSSLNFYQTLPLMSASFDTDEFGHSVSLYKDTIVVGAPSDREFQEYSGSSFFKQGSVYFFERCPGDTRGHGFHLIRKSYGNEKSLKNNLLGHSVSTWGDYSVVGCPKSNAEAGLYLCYIRGSLFQQHYCSDNLENAIQGQYILYQRQTSSLATTEDWDIVNVFQRKKRLLNPYRSYGHDVSICEGFLSVGSPMHISGSDRIMDVSNSGSFIDGLDNITSLSGKGYIYNLRNLRENFYVGNVFYRNGKVVVMASGSSFSGLMLSNIPGEEYLYQINFKSKQTLFEKQIVCAIEPGEFNVSTNPTAIDYPISSFDMNNNGKFDFQDVDILLRYMKYKSTETPGPASTDWSSSLLLMTNQNGIIEPNEEEVSVYNMYAAQWDSDSTNNLFELNFSSINSLFMDLDFNEDSKIDFNDQSILWKYFIYRLTQKNYETFITPNSQKKFLSDILDYLNDKTKRQQASQIKSDFLDFESLSKTDPTGSYLAPYVTTIGFYSGCDLVAVAKLGSPIKITPDFPMNFVVKMDF
jgi:hypothetical protein